MYFFFQKLFRIYFRLFYRFQVEGAEHVPQTGPVVIACNHISNYDPLSLGSAVDRQIHYMAKEKLFRIWGIAALVRSWGAFPVKRGAVDRGAIRMAMQILAEGRVLGIFPEGHRSKTGKLGPAYPGVVSFALRGTAAVIPVAVIGPYRLFRPVRVRIGTPIDLSDYIGVKTTSVVLEDAANVIMSAIEQLILSNE
ncbi:MAG: 1-acyl-sn-glycerol-3-phosphate acyltransferase [Bacilli bacterium]|nr:1-acyl-sn-glycerol-3-phosphate acyltransferase [Bacilli bacterium]